MDIEGLDILTAGILKQKNHFHFLKPGKISWDLARKVTVTNSAVSLMLSHAVSQGGAGKDIYPIYTIYNAQTLNSEIYMCYKYECSISKKELSCSQIIFLSPLFP